MKTDVYVHIYIYREKELAKVTIMKEDLELIVSSNALVDGCSSEVLPNLDSQKWC